MRPADCGTPPTTARPSPRCLTTRPSPSSARSRWTGTPAPSGPALARSTPPAPAMPASASTAAPTGAPTGNTWAWPTATTSGAWPSPPTAPSTWRPSAPSTKTTHRANAASTVGQKPRANGPCCSTARRRADRLPARSTSSSMPPMKTTCTSPCGTAPAGRGTSPKAAPAAAFSNPSTAAPPGSV